MDEAGENCPYKTHASGTHALQSESQLLAPGIVCVCVINSGSDRVTENINFF